MSSNVSVEDRPPKFHLKKSFHTNVKQTDLDKAIKKHNIRNLFKSGMSGVSKTYQTEGQENFGLQNHLDQLKKSCSQVTRQIKFKEDETSKFKDETSFTNDKSNKIKEDRQRLVAKIAQLQKKLESVTNKKQITTYSCKSYEHILERMKKDSIMMQLNKNFLEKQIKSLEKGYTILEHKHSEVNQFEKMSSTGLKDGQKQLQQQKLYREQHLQDVKRQTHNKIQQANKLKQRQKQTQTIQQLAADNIQDADLIKLKKYLTAQLFLRQLLKSKISKLKQYYEPYEMAFFKIKSNTSVKDANSLKIEFFNFESCYSEKTHWVKHLQQDILEAETEKKELEQQLRRNRMEEMDIIEKLESQEVIQSKINIRELNEKSLQYELSYERIQNWTIEQLKRLNVPVETEDAFEQFTLLITQII